MFPNSLQSITSSVACLPISSSTFQQKNDTKPNTPVTTEYSNDSNLENIRKTYYINTLKTVYKYAINDNSIGSVFTLSSRYLSIENWRLDYNWEELYYHLITDFLNKTNLINEYSLSSNFENLENDAIDHLSDYRKYLMIFRLLDYRKYLSNSSVELFLLFLGSIKSKSISEYDENFIVKVLETGTIVQQETAIDVLLSWGNNKLNETIKRKNIVIDNYYVLKKFKNL